MSLPKNGAPVHFILSDSIRALIRNSELWSVSRDPSIGGLAVWRNIAITSLESKCEAQLV